MRSATTASETRAKASQSAPNAGAATRMKANEPPHSPASVSSRATSPECIASVGGCERGYGYLGGLHSERELSADSGVRALVVEQPLLAPQTAAVAGQRPVGADNAMAGHDDGELVVAV